jgi:outer membrane protein assembly factor BamD
MDLRRISGRKALLVAAVGLLSGCMHKKYETPIAKNTQQPDKVLFDQAVKDIERGRYETARISLQTLMNTYESSEYLAKAKLAVADSWFREGGANGMAQAEAEYKDFQLFYPNMEEAAEAQNRICEIHYKEMDKSDRDITQTRRAEEECRQLLIQYPNSKFAPQATQRLRDIQESLAEHEFTVGNYYWKHDMNPAAANRLNGLVDQYPLYSNAGEALFEAGDAYGKMGPRFRKQAGEMYARIVQEYPLSDRAKDAKKRLGDMELPVPQADPGAVSREKFEEANYHKPGMMTRSMEWMKGSPDVSHAAKMGAPTMHDMVRNIPVSVPAASNNEAGATSGTGSGTTDVTARQVSNTDTTLDKAQDVRSTSATAGTASSTTNSSASNAAAQPLPTNRDKELKKYREQQLKKQEKLAKKKKKQDKQDNQNGNAQPAQSQSANANPAPGTAGSAAANPAASTAASTGSTPPQQ